MVYVYFYGRGCYGPRGLMEMCITNSQYLQCRHGEGRREWRGRLGEWCEVWGHTPVNQPALYKPGGEPPAASFAICPCCLLIHLFAKAHTYSLCLRHSPLTYNFWPLATTGETGRGVLPVILCPPFYTIVLVKLRSLDCHFVFGCSLVSFCL